MANKAHLTLLKKGVKVWNEWRAHNPDLRADLHSADLRRANLKQADLSLVDLSEANLWGANLHGAYLSRTELSQVNLSEARLNEADLSRTDLSRANLGRAKLRMANLYAAKLAGADLSGADLHWADLSGANLGATILSEADLTGADLTGADLSGANLGQTRLGNSTMWATKVVDVDLSRVKGLESVQHRGPSTIGIDTIYLSKGKIPEVFLHQAGVPEPFIVQMKALVGAMERLQFYSCFISYSSKDHEFAERLYADLQQKNVRCWFAPEDVKIGDKFRQRIDEAIRVYDKLLLVLTKSSVKSTWVEKEVESAFEKERKQKRAVLFPIRLDDAVMDTKEAWAADIRRVRHMGDFRGWKVHDTYRQAFERLMRDLKAGTEVRDKGKA